MIKIVVGKYFIYLTLIALLALITCRPSADPLMEKPANSARPCQLEIQTIGDSRLFCVMARYPMQLFDKNNFRQSKPLYILSAAGLNYLIHAIFYTFGLNSGLIKGYITEYLSYIVLNFSFLFLAIILFDRLFVPSKTISFTIVALSIFLLVNDVAIVYLWYPHTQLLNVLLSIFLITISRKILEDPTLFLKHLIPISILSGILCTLYGSFIIALPVIIISYLVSCYINRNNNTHVQIGLLSIVARITIMAALVILPTLVWFIIITNVTGNYYNPEFSNSRRFIWVLDVLKEGGVKKLVLKFLYDVTPWYIKPLSTVSWKYLLLLITSLSIFHVMDIKIRNISYLNKLNILASIICIVPIMSFFYFQIRHPYYAQERFFWNVVPPILVIIGALLSEITPRLNHKKRFLINIAFFLTAIAPLAISQKVF